MSTFIIVFTTVGSTSTVPKEISYADDGFAMGVAYILAILKQVQCTHAKHLHSMILSYWIIVFEKSKNFYIIHIVTKNQEI